jgi:hypothetical protein
VHVYTVYGLSLQSEFAIPELLSDSTAQAGRGAFDVNVSFGAIPQDWQSPTALGADGQQESWAERRAEANETLCVFSGVGRYLVRAGHAVTVEPEPGVDASLMRHLLLGPVLAHLLWQRGIFTLHSSVVCIGGQHAGFVGVSGEGKSTTAAALEARGHALVCDDIAALTERDGRFQVLPAFPRIRLYGDSVEGIGDDPTRYPWVHPLIAKRSKGVQRFISHAVPLDRLYVLATGDQLGIEPMANRDAIMELIRHTYYVHQYAPLFGFKQQMQQAAAVVMQVRVFKLTRPKDLARLPELVGLLEAEAAT